MNRRPAEENPYVANTPEALPHAARSDQAPLLPSLTSMFLLAQAAVVILIGVADWMAAAFVLPYVFVLVFYVRAAERSTVERAHARQWRAARSRRPAWVFCLVAAGGAWPFVYAVLGPRPSVVAGVAIAAVAAVSATVAAFRMWAKDARTVRTDLAACGPLLVQSVLATVAVGLATASAAPVVTYAAVLLAALAGPLPAIVLLISACAVVQYVRPVPSTPAAYRTAAWAAVVVAAVHAMRAPLPEETESGFVALALGVLAGALTVAAGRGRRRAVFAVSAVAFVGLIALSEQWLDTVAFAVTAAVVATGPLLTVVRQDGAPFRAEEKRAGHA
jgi:hypothetical protein